MAKRRATQTLPAPAPGPPAPAPRIPWLVAALFFLSGAFGLIYEVTWVRAITLEFGSTTLSVSTVVTVFMGGLALGAWQAGRRIDRSTRPLTTYGVLELVLACYTLLTPLLFSRLLPLFVKVAFRMSENIVTLTAVRFCATTLLLLLPTLLMGATLPVLARFWALREHDGGRGAGLLYGVNTTGGFVGTGVAGFLLLPHLGMHRTILACAACNLLLGLVALAAGRRLEGRGPAPAPAPAPVAEAAPVVGAPAADRAAWTMYLAVALTGFAAMMCEVTWTRVLILVLGASVYAFSTVLATFLAGLGLGSAGVAALLRSAPARARTVFYGLATAAAVLASLTALSFEHLPSLFISLYASLGAGNRPDLVFVSQFVVSAAAIFVPSFVMGGLFPAAARVLLDRPEATGTGVGRLYTWNTVGSILGSFAAGFVFIPALGIRGTLITAAVAQAGGGAVAVLAPALARRRPLLIAGSLAAVAASVVIMPAWHRQLMTSATFLYPDFFRGQSAQQIIEKVSNRFKLLFYEDGLTATVTVARESPSGDLLIATNGKIDGSSFYDMPTQRLSAHLPLLLHPDPKEVAIVGIGTGITGGSAALHPVDRVVVLEIEPAMVEGSRLFKPYNHDVHANPKVDVKVTDGRLHLNLNPGAYDVVISEPSNPWLAGSSDLFTREYFEYGRRALRPDGIFLQWLQIYNLSPESIRVIARTFASVYPHVYLASTILDTDTLLIGSQVPIVWDLGRIERRMQLPGVREDLADHRLGVRDVYDLLARVRMGTREVQAFGGGGVLHTDDLPVIAYRAPRELYRETRETNAAALAAAARGIVPYLEGNDLGGTGRREFFERLSTAYRVFLGTGNESRLADAAAAGAP